jgi:hypothetical protein
MAGTQSFWAALLSVWLLEDFLGHRKCIAIESEQGNTGVARKRIW